MYYLQEILFILLVFTCFKNIFEVCFLCRKFEEVWRQKKENKIQEKEQGNSWRLTKVGWNANKLFRSNQNFSYRFCSLFLTKTTLGAWWVVEFGMEFLVSLLAWPDFKPWAGPARQGNVKELSMIHSASRIFYVFFHLILRNAYGLAKCRNIMITPVQLCGSFFVMHYISPKQHTILLL